MPDLLYFLGRFHVLVLHLPIGILLLAAFMECLVRRPRFAALQPGMPFIWLAGAICALVTVTLGYMHAAEGGFDGPAINSHRNSGVALTLFAFAVWAWRSESPASFNRGWLVAVLGTTALLFVTGHYGGNLTHGSTFLVQYAPGPIRSLAGLPEGAAPRPPVTDIAAADIFLDVIAPALQRRCGSCHNDDKRRGKFSITSHANLLKGGESGAAAIVPGNLQASDLYRRINLPHEHIDFMPKDGKTPLNPQEVAAIEWWIKVGAPKSGTLAELQAPEQVRQTIAGVLGLMDTE